MDRKLARHFRGPIAGPITSAFGCIAALLLLGSLYSSSFLSPEYLLQQLKVASFLGVIATGAMIVILLGQIDPGWWRSAR
jgi:ribose transport system permease protein